ncbi:hypothetical protein VCRA2117O380_30292 [Vibrio crassostreae]|nr:hypothetical protein VCRA2110O182_10154 [Vibrio crassostreae]CAK2051051.1 hypothetical protein VCRA2119O381_410011 [Vibrio crassostreae]CAK2064031.1 hypothetical protein VCRA2117O379_30292 [Vibrio crassostreae]CAK2065532.1 hypothetical protein VCRA2119O382_30292 [Vibrio crassostreae]CAK2068623.1 hypothetical protein VCRA2117O380_30292 [Vibrio crassostreae]
MTGQKKYNKQFKQTVNAWHFQLGLASVITVVNLSVFGSVVSYLIGR